jgi:hypothetical protein
LFKWESLPNISISGACLEQPLRALRANRVFCTDKMHIRTENAVIEKSEDAPGV